MSLRVPVATLRIFDAAARHQSFRAAAQELNLTPSAVSHAIKRMEDSLGVPLFERLGLKLVSARRPHILRLNCAPSFAANWLTPRLSRFLSQHPKVELPSLQVSITSIGISLYIDGTRRIVTPSAARKPTGTEVGSSGRSRDIGGSRCLKQLCWRTVRDGRCWGTV